MDSRWKPSQRRISRAMAPQTQEAGQSHPFDEGRSPKARYTSQASGYFRRLDNGTIAKASDLVKGLFHHPPNENRYKKLKALQTKTGYSIAQIVLGYLLGQPFPVFPIVGPKTVADLEESLSASEVTLTADQVDFLTADP